MWVLALSIIISSYTVVVYKVKKQSQKIAAPSGGGGAPATSQATVGKSEVLPSAAEVTKSSTKPGCSVKTSGQQTVAAARKEGEPKLETRMLKLCLGITCLAALSYTALFTVVVLDLPYSLNYLYSLNHVGNPVIYCMISKAYRNDVFDTARLILGNIKKTVLRR